MGTISYRLKSVPAPTMEVKTVPVEGYQQDSGNSATIENNENNTEIKPNTEKVEEMDTSGTKCEYPKDQAQEKSQDVNNDTQSNTETAENNNVEINNSVDTTPEKNTTANSDDRTRFTKRVNTLKRKRTRPIKRKRKKYFNIQQQAVPEAHVIERVVESDPSVDTMNTSVETSKEDKEYCLTVSNLPNNWSFMEIKNYIDTECGPVDEIEMIKDDKTGIGAIRLSYQTEDECSNAMQKLQDKEVSGNKLTLEMTAIPLELDSDSETDTTEASKKPWRPDLDPWEVYIDGLYGLKRQYLKSLGITPPLDKWVHVSNFRCDKSELRDVMEMAGNVQMCSIFMVSNRYANVQYSHPLEAVQAVSMLNNQLFYGMMLKVTMDRSPINTVLLPKGLSGIGQGLGLHGKPLRNIVQHYERFVENKDCLINPTMFDVPDDHSMKQKVSCEATFEVKSVEDFNYPDVDKLKKKVSTTAPVKMATPKKVSTPKSAKIQTPAFTVSQPRPVPPVKANFTPPPQQNFQQRGFAPNFMPFNQMMNGQVMPGPQGPVGPIGPQGPMGPLGPCPMGPPMQGLGPQPQFAQPFQGPGPGPMGPVWNPGLGPVRPGAAFPNEPVKLMMGNLPPSTTFGLLCEKMSEWGHVVCIQLTTPGCAVVTFANRMQADACFQHFNGRNIENHIIHMKYA